jgi:hypothetical protein
MKLTSQEYAEMVVNEYYKVPNIANLAKAIARVADKYAKWTILGFHRDNYALSEDADLALAQELQHEASIKREAYRLALFMLTDKLPK